MLFSTLLVPALLASSTWALPSSRERFQKRADRRAGRSTPRQNTNVTHEEFSSNWAGAVYNSPAGTYQSVTATFTVPTPQEASGVTGQQSASAWVGIDGDSCQNAILQTGVDFTVDDSGTVSYDAWYEWFPDYAYDFSGISFNPGDSVTLTVTADSTTSGSCVITNNSNGQSVTQPLTSSSALCEQDAEWIVEDFEEGGGLVPFCNFGTVTFEDASAGTPDGWVGPGTANLIDIQQNGQVLTSSSVSDSSVTVSYV